MYFSMELPEKVLTNIKFVGAYSFEIIQTSLNIIAEVICGSNI